MDFGDRIERTRAAIAASREGIIRSRQLIVSSRRLVEVRPGRADFHWPLPLRPMDQPFFGRACSEQEQPDRRV